MLSAGFQEFFRPFSSRSAPSAQSADLFFPACYNPQIPQMTQITTSQKPEAGRLTAELASSVGLAMRRSYAAVAEVGWSWNADACVPGSQFSCDCDREDEIAGRRNDAGRFSAEHF